MTNHHQTNGTLASVVVWGLHVCDLDWAHPPLLSTPRSWDKVENTRSWLQQQAGPAGTPIWITEFGVVFGFDGFQVVGGLIRPSGCWRADVVNGFVTDMATRLTTRGAQFGVQKWFLYSALPRPFLNRHPQALPNTTGRGCACTRSERRPCSNHGGAVVPYGGWPGPADHDPSNTLRDGHRPARTVGGSSGSGGSGEQRSAAPQAVPTARSTPSPTATIRAASPPPPPPPSATAIGVPPLPASVHVGAAAVGPPFASFSADRQGLRVLGNTLGVMHDAAGSFFHVTIGHRAECGRVVGGRPPPRYHCRADRAPLRCETHAAFAVAGAARAARGPGAWPCAHRGACGPTRLADGGTTLAQERMTRVLTPLRRRMRLRRGARLRRRTLLSLLGGALVLGAVLAVPLHNGYQSLCRGPIDVYPTLVAARDQAVVAAHTGPPSSLTWTAATRARLLDTFMRVKQANDIAFPTHAMVGSLLEVGQCPAAATSDQWRKAAAHAWNDPAARLAASGLRRTLHATADDAAVLEMLEGYATAEPWHAANLARVESIIRATGIGGAEALSR